MNTTHTCLGQAAPLPGKHSLVNTPKHGTFDIIKRRKKRLLLPLSPVFRCLEPCRDIVPTVRHTPSLSLPSLSSLRVVHRIHAPEAQKLQPTKRIRSCGGIEHCLPRGVAPGSRGEHGATWEDRRGMLAPRSATAHAALCRRVGVRLLSVRRIALQRSKVLLRIHG